MGGNNDERETFGKSFQVGSGFCNTCFFCVFLFFPEGRLLCCCWGNKSNCVCLSPGFFFALSCESSPAAPTVRGRSRHCILFYEGFPTSSSTVRWAVNYSSICPGGTISVLIWSKGFNLQCGSGFPASREECDRAFLSWLWSLAP